MTLSLQMRLMPKTVVLWGKVSRNGVRKPHLVPIKLLQLLLDQEEELLFLIRANLPTFRKVPHLRNFWDFKIVILICPKILITALNTVKILSSISIILE